MSNRSHEMQMMRLGFGRPPGSTRMYANPRLAVPNNRRTRHPEIYVTEHSARDADPPVLNPVRPPPTRYHLCFDYAFV